ncbi:MAG TPA: serine/threonine-protein kinase, partial [Nitriliruptoraceae bacterium]|nr:serine/threonine-protein kinase [Nitriliruptoraceae bacterium]
MDLPVDALVADRYRITDRLGRGGMAVVYEAHDEVLDRPVAVKVLADHLLDDDRSIDRFEREARAAAGLNHPNVVAVHDASSDGDTHYLVMELVQGESLAHRLKAGGPMEVDEALVVGDAVAAALAAAHARQIVHRDVKPSNILLTDDGQVKVTDFGIARAVATAATQTAVVMGSVPYIAPEQLDGRSGADPRSDLYALGCVLYECLTGRPPFVSDTSAAVLGQHLHLPAPRVSEHRPGVGEPVDDLLASLLAKDPDDRPPSAADLRQRIARVRDGQPPVAPGPGAAGAGATAAGALGAAGVGAAAAAAAAGARAADPDAPTDVVDPDMPTEVVDQDLPPTEVIRPDDAAAMPSAAAGAVAGASAAGMGDDRTARLDESDGIDETMRLDQTMRLEDEPGVDETGMGLPPGAGPTD